MAPYATFWNQMSLPIAMKLSPELVAVLEAQGVKPEAYAPAYAGESAGLDLYNAGPDLVIRPILSINAFATQTISVPGGGTIEVPAPVSDWLAIPAPERQAVYKTLVPTGLHLALPSGWVGLLRERGSVSKTPLSLRAGVIDPGYTDQIYVSTINHAPVPYLIKSGEKLPFQLVVVPFASTFLTVSEQAYEVYAEAALRRSGKIGSSDSGA